LRTDLTSPDGCQHTRTLNYRATDACGNSAVCAQVITWTVDTTPPVFTNCANINLGCNPTNIPGCDPVGIGPADNCSVSTVSCFLAQVTNGCVRTRTLTYTATDACGNSNTCTQLITWTVDTVAPVFTLCPTNLNLGSNPTNAIPDCNTSTNNVAATDNCGPPTITCSKVDATNGCVRTRTLTYTAKDACNNSNTCVQVITWTVDPAPLVLSIQLQGTNVVISWPLTCGPCVLEQTPSLSPPITWTPTPGPIVVVSGQNTVTVPLSTNNTFYRLRCP
jgi:hypothetical protein